MRTFKSDKPELSEVKVSFKNRSFKIDEENRTVTCTLDCKARLDILEQRTNTFSQAMLRNVISKYLKLKIKKLKSNYRLHTMKNDDGEISVIRFVKADNYLKYKYDPTFQVSATATCDKLDTFDKSIGKKVAENKAKAQAYQWLRQIMCELYGVYSTGADICENTIKKMDHLIADDKAWIEKF